MKAFVSWKTMRELIETPISAKVRKTTPKKIFF